MTSTPTSTDTFKLLYKCEEERIEENCIPNYEAHGKKISRRPTKISDSFKEILMEMGLPQALNLLHLMTTCNYSTAFSQTKSLN
jgi:hypothetical protein